ncbi:hypothetical protein AAC387_Pa03g0782 [Persea americana]
MASEGVKNVKLFGTWASSYTHRVQLALKLKGVEFEYVEEDLSNKSPLLLTYNPVYKKVPVLLHGERAIAESIVILEYLDETWKEKPIMSQDPYQRAIVRFWCRFADEKGRRFFGGDEIGLLDIVMGCGSFWLWVFEEVAEAKLVDPEMFPRFHSWLRDFEEQNQVKEIIPATDKLLEYAKSLRQMILNQYKP